MLKRVVSKNSIPSINTSLHYLEYAREKCLNPAKPVFRGTFYEFLMIERLREKLMFENLRRVGGPSDKGLDLHGSWNFSKYVGISSEKLSSQSSLYTQSGAFGINSHDLLAIQNNKSSMSPSYTISNVIRNLDVLIQCKNTSKKVPGKLIRELNGIFQYHTNSKCRNSTLMVLIAPTLLTPSGRNEFNAAESPILYCHTNPLKLINIDDPYKGESWQGGDLIRFDINLRAEELLRAHILSHN